jgi:hypothetical protein
MAFVIYSPELGVYLGNCLGLGFWSKLDPVGQPCAVTFPTIYEAQRHAASWDTPVKDMQFIPVQADDVSKRLGQPDYASIAACVAAGLPAWDPDEVNAAYKVLSNKEQVQA